MRVRSSAASRRRGMSALEVIMVTGMVVPMAAALYWMFEMSMDQFWFLLGNAVGWPFL